MPYKTRILKKWCLVCLGLFAAALVLSWLQSAASAAQSESQLTNDTESEASFDSFAFKQSFDTTTAWVANDTTIEFDVSGAAKGGLYFAWYCDAWTYYQNGFIFSIDGTHSKKTITTTAASIQAMIDDGWNACGVRGWLVYMVGNTTRFWGSSNAGSYPDGVFYNNWGTHEDAYVKDAYFKILAYADAIEITFPENATTTPDFAAWKTEFSVKNTPPVYGSLKLNYGTSSSTLTSFDTLNFEAYDNESAPANIPKSLLLLPYTTYYAQANILNASSTVIATSTLIYFTTAGVGEFYENNYYAIPTSTIATSTPIQITCDPDDPWYAYSLCKLAVWLFVPSPVTLNQFSTLGDTLKNKPPMGYFYRVKETLIFSATSTPAFNLENASTTLAASIYNPLKTGIAFLLWLVFGFWIFNRIRHLAL